MSDDAGKRRWLTGAFVFFGAFIIFIVSLVIYVSSRDVQLVDENYYQRELEYQDKIENLNRTRKLADELQVTYDEASGVLTIDYPPNSYIASTQGKIRLYRPSDASLDRNFDVKPDGSGRQTINAVELATGYWQVKVDWISGTEQYFTQKRLIIRQR